MSPLNEYSICIYPYSATELTGGNRWMSFIPIFDRENIDRWHLDNVCWLWS